MSAITPLRLAAHAIFFGCLACLTRAGIAGVSQPVSRSHIQLADLEAFCQGDGDCADWRSGREREGEQEGATPTSLLQTRLSISLRTVASSGNVTIAAMARPLDWVHVPKTGSSLINILMHLPGMCPFISETATMDGPCFKEFLQSFPPGDFCPGSFQLQAHRFLGDHSGIGTTYEAYTKGHGVIMLRQPEQRLLSGYYYEQHSWPAWYYGRMAANAREYAEVLSGCAVRMLTRDASPIQEGGPPDLAPRSACGWPEPPTAVGVQIARQRLQEGFVFVGLTEQWELSVCLMHAIFGGECRSSDFIDVRPTDPSSANSSIMEYNISELQGLIDVYDGPLYEDAKDIFATDLKRYGLSQVACEPCFRQGGILGS